MKPYNFRQDTEKWYLSLNEIYQIIAFCGLKLLQSGKIIKIKPINTLKEEINRTNSLYEKLIVLEVHSEVLMKIKLFKLYY